MLVIEVNPFRWQSSSVMNNCSKSLLYFKSLGIIESDSFLINLLVQVPFADSAVWSKCFDFNCLNSIIMAWKMLLMRILN